MKKEISYLLSATIIASLINVPLNSYSSDTSGLSDVITLFEDDFEGYSAGFEKNIASWKKPSVADVTGSTQFEVYGHNGVPTSNATYYSPAADPAKTMQIADSVSSGIGTGSSLMITAQSGLQQQQLIKASGIDSTAVNKKLVFTAKFIIPDFVGYSDGAGIYLAAENSSDVYESNSANPAIHLSSSASNKDGELVYLGARPGSNRTDGWGAYWDVNNNHNQLWTFGEKVADLTPGTEYTYTVTMTPDSNGKYDVTADLNGTEYTLGQADYSTSSSIPTAEEMAEFSAVRVMRLTHQYNFMLGHVKAGTEAAFSTWLTTGYGSGLGITSDDDKYNNDRVVAYFDDISMKAEPILTETPSPTTPPVSDGVIFSDDFESYDTIPGSLGWGTKAPENYESNMFKWFCGAASEVTGAITAYFSSAGTAGDTAKIVTDSGVGSGKALKFTGQPYLSHYTMAKKSNLDLADITDKQLVFSAKFKAPSSMAIGEGFGIWIMKDSGNSEIFYISDKTGITDGTESLENELLYVGARERGASAPVRIYAFGEPIAIVDTDTVYEYKVTLTPDDDGKYTASITYNGITKQLTGTNVPAAEQIKEFNRLHISPTLHEWRVWDAGYAQNINSVPQSAKDADGHYIVGRDIGIIDDLKLISQDSEGVPAPTVFSSVTVTDGTGSGTYAEGEKVTVTANSKTGFTFKQWNVTSQNVTPEDITAAQTSFIMPAENVTIEAEYTDNSITPIEPIGGNVNYFSDDFESYTEIEGLSGWSNNKPSKYDSDKFKYFYAQISAPADDHEAAPYFGTATGTPSETAKIISDSGVGSGQALEITGQTFVSHYSILKSSGITEQNTAGKQLVFETTFKAPNPMTMGEGFGVWAFADANETAIAYPSDNTDIIKGTGAPVRNELLYVSTRTKAPSSVKIYAFGEEVLTVDHDTVYNYKLTLTPAEDGNYTAIATVNGVSKALAGTNVPTQLEFGTLNRLHVSPVTHEWYMWEYGFERSYKNVPDNVKGSDGLYEAGRTLGIIDNISLKGCDVFGVEEVIGLNAYNEIPITDSAVTLKMTGHISSVNNSKITVDNGAVITASVDDTDLSLLRLTFENLKAKTKYKLGMAEVFNDIGAEYTGELEFVTSDGIDVLPVELNGSASGIIDRVNPNKIKVSIQKHLTSTVTSSPEVLISVDKVIDGIYKNVRMYHASVPVTSEDNFVEITNVTVGEGEIIRVFVWNDNTQMKPITSVTVFTD